MRASECYKRLLTFTFIGLVFSASAFAKREPMRFDAEAAAAEIPMRLDYDLSNGKVLKLGTAEFSDKSFRFLIVRAKQLDKRFSKIMSKSEADQWVMVGTWPDSLMRSGKLEVIDRGGRTIWTKDWNEEAIKDWNGQLGSWQKALIKMGVKEADAKKIRVSDFQFGMVDLNKENSPFWNVSEPIRFCLSQQVDQAQTRMCTQYYEVARKGTSIGLRSFSSADVPARVIVMNESAPASAKREVEAGSLVQFFAETSSGASLEFVGKPRRLNLVEIAKGKSGNYLTVTGFGVKPQERVAEINKEKESYWVDLLGWQDTIGDDREFWQTRVTESVAFLTVPGEGAGVFVQPLPVQNLPPEEARPYLNEGSVKGTYKSIVKLKGRVSPKVKLSSEMKSLEQDSKGNFVWNFQADNSPEINKSYVNIALGDQNYKAYGEIYRAFPAEFSFRLTGGLGGEKTVAMGESAFNYWFENLYGWENPRFSTQRWGMSVKYFMSLSDITAGTVSAPFKALTADLKYRLTPGLWNRDASWGLILGLNDVNYDVYVTKMMGAGFFWGRSMPLVFDNIFNWFPFFRYPKWVDLEFLYYPSIMDSAFVAGGSPNYALNFHGKVMWTKRIFGEAGFGVKNLSLTKLAVGAEDEQGFTLATFYATVGLGILF